MLQPKPLIPSYIISSALNFITHQHVFDSEGYLHNKITCSVSKIDIITQASALVTYSTDSEKVWKFESLTKLIKCGDIEVLSKHTDEFYKFPFSVLTFTTVRLEWGCRVQL
jgi:hypothetical protein